MITLVLALSLSAAASQPTQVLNQVQATYQKGGDLSASFEQVYVDKLRGKKKVESGKLWAKRDGRVRWSFTEPVPKDFVFTGKAAYFYEPDNAQVTIYEKYRESPLWNALRFLWGEGNVTDSFDVKPCDDECPPAGANEVQVWLVPKEPLAAVDHVIVAVDTKASRVVRSVVYDSLGNRTEYHFSDVQLGETLAPELFEFPIPEGVQVLRATGG